MNNEQREALKRYQRAVAALKRRHEQLRADPLSEGHSLKTLQIGVDRAAKECRVLRVALEVITK